MADSNNYRLLVRTLGRFAKLDGKVQFIYTEAEYKKIVLTYAITAVVFVVGVVLVTIATWGTGTLGTIVAFVKLGASIGVGIGAYAIANTTNNPIIRALVYGVSAGLIYTLMPVQLILPAVISYFGATYSAEFTSGLLAQHIRYSSQTKLNNSSLVVSTNPADYIF